MLICIQSNLGDTMKIKLLTLAVLSAISVQSFALTKNLDFYSGNSNANRYTVFGKVSELPEVKANGKLIFVENIDNNAYIRLNEQSPNYIGYVSNDSDLYSILKSNKGQELTLPNGAVTETFKLVDVMNYMLLLESTTDTNKGSYKFVKIDQNLVLPKTWFVSSSKGLKALFDNDIKPDDIVYYSQQEGNLNYTNEYQGVLKDGKNFKLVHYVNVFNGSDKVYDHVNLNFFLSEANIQNNRPMPLYRAKGAVMMAAAMEMDTAGKPEFSNVDVGELKSITLKDPVTIYPNTNKIKHTDKVYPYEQYTQMNIDSEFKLYFNSETQSNSESDEAKSYARWLEQSKLDITNNIVNSQEFKNMILVKLDKDDIIPSGDLQVYDNVNNVEKLIVSTNINQTEHKDLDIFKSENKDLKVSNIVFFKEVTKEMQVNNYNKAKSVFLEMKEFTLKNNGKLDYNVSVNGVKHLVKANSSIVISLEKDKKK